MIRTKRWISIVLVLLCLGQASLAAAAEQEFTRPIPAWPIIWHRSDDGRVETDLLFSLIHYEREKNKSAFSFRPYLFWTETDADRDYFKVSLLFRLANYEREGTSSSFYVAPLYWTWADATSLHTFNLIPPYYHRRMPGEDIMHAWPFYSGISKGSYREWGGLYPFIRFGRDPQNNVELDQVLLYYRKREQDRSYMTIFPLYFQREDGAERSTWFLPVYFSRSDATTQRTVNIFPPYYHNKEPGEETLHVWPLYSDIEKGSYRERGGLYPLIRFGRDPVNKIGLDQFLLYYRKTEPNRAFTTFFPFYFKKVDGEQRQTWLLPLYYGRSDATTARSINVFPPVYYNREPGEATLHAWPFYSTIEKGSYREYGFLYPLFRHGRDPNLQYELDYYLLYYRKKEQDRTVTMFFPLYGREEDGARHVAWFIPLFFHRHDESSLRTLAPLYYRSRDPGQETYYLWPFYRDYAEGTYREHSVLYPLFLHGRDPELEYEIDYYLLYYRKKEIDRSFTTFLPLYFHRAEGGERSTWFLPLYYSRSDATTLHTVNLIPPYYHHKELGEDIMHAWPFYSEIEKGSYREYAFLYPLFRHGRDPDLHYELDFYLLFYRSREPDRSFTTFFPLWYSSRTSGSSWRLFLPLYYDSTAAGETTQFIAPTYYDRTSPDGSVNTLFPLYVSRSREDAQSLYVFPTYYQERTSSTNLHTFIPFYVDYESPESNVLAFIPLYFQRKSPESAFTTFLPIYYDYHKTDFDLTLGLPVYLKYRSEAYTFRTIFPIYYATEDTSLRTSFTYYFPFYGEYRRGDAATRHFLFFPLYDRYEDQEAQLKGWDALWPLIHYESSPTTRTVRVPPFYWADRSPERSYTVFFPVYWEFVRGESSYEHIIPIYSVHKEGDWRTSRYVFWLLYTDTRDTRTGVWEQDAVFSLYGRRVEGDRERTWVFPIYYHRSDPESRLTLALPLLPYYHSIEADRESQHLFPVYSRMKEGSYTEYASLWPLFRHGRDPERHYELDYYLLFYRKQEQGRTYTTFFPFYGQEEEGDRHVEWLIPAFYHRHEGSSLKTLGLLYYRNREPGQETYYLWPFYRNYAEGSYREYSVLYPLFRHGRDPVNQVELDYYLLFYRKQEQDRSFTTFFPVWYSSQAPESRWNLFLPVYYDRADASSQMAVAPFYYSARDPGQETYYLWPFYRDQTEGSYREYSVLYPLFRHGRDPANQVELDYYLLFYRKREQDRSFTTFFPVWYSSQAPESRWRLFLPVYYDRADASSHMAVAPFYYGSMDPGQETLYLWPFYRDQTEGSYREYSVLYPLFRHGRDPVNQVELDYYLLYYRKQEQDRTFTLFFPLYGRTDEGPRHTQWFLPLFYHRHDESSQMAVAPFYYGSMDPGQETLYLWPFYRDQTEGSYREYSVLYPLFRHGRDPEKQYALDYYLLFYRKSEQDRSLTTLFPLWWHREAGTAALDATPFLYWYEHDRQSGNADFSLLWLVPPQLSLFRYTREGTTVYHRLFPLYSYTADEERHVSNWSILWFLFSYESEGEFASQSGFLWKVITYERKDAETYDFRFLWRFIRKSGTPTSSTFEFNPIFYSEDDTVRGSYWAILGGLIGRETFPDGRTKMRFLWVF